jgi:hypothetical protein
LPSSMFLKLVGLAFMSFDKRVGLVSYCTMRD